MSAKASRADSVIRLFMYDPPSGCFLGSKPTLGSAFMRGYGAVRRPDDRLDEWKGTRMRRMTETRRPDGRAADALRPVRITPGALKFAEGSVLIEVGDTRVLCAASVEGRVPH